MVLILFPASRSLPFFFFFKLFSSDPSQQREVPQGEQVGQRFQVPPPPAPGSPPALSAESSHPGWPWAGPKLEAEVLGVGAGRREHILFRVHRRAVRWEAKRQKGWPIESWAPWPRPRAGLHAVIFILCFRGVFACLSGG